MEVTEAIRNQIDGEPSFLPNLVLDNGTKVSGSNAVFCPCNMVSAVLSQFLRSFNPPSTKSNRIAQLKLMIVSHHLCSVCGVNC